MSAAPKSMLGILFAGSMQLLFASNLANPAAMLPDARVAVGASYHLGGYTIGNREAPCILNRIHGRGSYAPMSWLNVGIDLGATQMEVAADTSDTDTIGAFHGTYGPSAGAHIKLSTPYFFNSIIALVGIAQGTYFYSENDDGARYSGPDGIGVVGLQFHIPSVGYITAGPQLYLIKGRNRSYRGTENEYSNVNNLRGWLALDLFPPAKFGGDQRFYISAEVSVSPDVKFNERAPVQEISFSIAIGSVTKRLYGEEKGIEWKP